MNREISLPYGDKEVHIKLPEKTLFLGSYSKRRSMSRK